MGILTATVYTRKHGTVAIVANGAQVPLDPLKKAECVNFLSLDCLILLVIVEAANCIEQDVLKVLRYSEGLQELNNWLVLVITEKREFALAQFNVQLVVYMRRVDLP